MARRLVHGDRPVRHERNVEKNGRTLVGELAGDRQKSGVRVPVMPCKIPEHSVTMKAIVIATPIHRSGDELG